MYNIRLTDKIMKKLIFICELNQCGKGVNIYLKFYLTNQIPFQK
jgi:hypothetical protein